MDRGYWLFTVAGTPAGVLSIGGGLALIFHGLDETVHGAQTAIDGEIHRNLTAQWLDQYTGSEFWSDIIDGAIGIILTLGAKAPATVGEYALRYGFRKVGKELTEAGITRAGPAAKFLEKQAARRAAAAAADDLLEAVVTRRD